MREMRLERQDNLPRIWNMLPNIPTVVPSSRAPQMAKMKKNNTSWLHWEKSHSVCWMQEETKGVYSGSSGRMCTGYT